MKVSFLFMSLLIAVLLSQSLLAQTAPPVDREAEIRQLRQELDTISARLGMLESEEDSTHQSTSWGLSGASAAPSDPAAVAEATSASSPTAQRVDAKPAAVLGSEDVANLAFLRGTTLSFGIDGYYGYNFNAPVGRVNLLRAYDVSSNSFSLNQVNFIVEHLPSTTERLGGRIDLQYGQATETLQGSPVNEQRPEVWRNLFQAYGSYLAPVGSGLQIDFGKFASSLGNEGNYTKDQIAYSRAYSFNYLPFYHMGLRANYNVNAKVNIAYWLVNGANDTEDLNGFKSQAFVFTLKPASTLTWNLNYYFGQEARDVLPTLNPGAPVSPTQPGLPTQNINPAPNGREHIFDTYATWNATPKLTLVGEADFVVNRTDAEQRPGRVVLGELAVRYALPHGWNVASRAEYLDDRGGLFSGTTQALKEVTLVADQTLAPGFIARTEYRRDFSNQRFFLTDTNGVLVHAQTTATLGLVYWWGTKQGSW